MVLSDSQNNLSDKTEVHKPESKPDGANFDYISNLKSYQDALPGKAKESVSFENLNTSDLYASSLDPILKSVLDVGAGTAQPTSPYNSLEFAGPPHEPIDLLKPLSNPIAPDLSS